MRKAFPVAVILAGSFTAAAAAQSALERVEKQVRKQVDLPDAAAVESSDSQKEERHRGIPPVKNAADRGYLGAFATDRDVRGRGVRIVEVEVRG